MNKRLEALQKRLKEENIDTILIASAENRRYLTNFSGTFGYVLLGQKNG